MTIKIKQINYEVKCGAPHIIFTFSRSDRKYDCCISVDELIITSLTPLFMHWDTEFDRIRWEEIKKEVAWCEKHFDELRKLYDE